MRSRRFLARSLVKVVVESCSVEVPYEGDSLSRCVSHGERHLSSEH